MDETKTLVAIYKTCKSELNLTDAQIQQVDQQVATGDQSYATQCGG
jgi:exonuclease VII small subunit